MAFTISQSKSIIGIIRYAHALHLTEAYDGPFTSLPLSVLRFIGFKEHRSVESKSRYWTHQARAELGTPNSKGYVLVNYATPAPVKIQAIILRFQLFLEHGTAWMQNNGAALRGFLGYGPIRGTEVIRSNVHWWDLCSKFRSYCKLMG